MTNKRLSFYKHVAQTRHAPPLLRCDFVIVANETNEEKLTIKDMNLGRMSVTNDIENVVRFLLYNSWVRGREMLKRLFYYDSEGRLDEVLINEKGFVDFKSVGM